MAACTAVLDTYELLENVISFLPPRKILTAERVCKTWKQLIDGSSKVSQSRCWAAGPRTEQSTFGDELPVFEGREVDLRFHPAVTQRPPWFVYERHAGVGVIQKTKMNLHVPRPKVSSLSAHAGHYLSSPPIGVLFLRIKVGEKVIKRTIRASGGLRFDDLQAAVETLVEEGDRDICTIEGSVKIDCGRLVKGSRRPGDKNIKSDLAAMLSMAAFAGCRPEREFHGCMVAQHAEINVECEARL